MEVLYAKEVYAVKAEKRMAQSRRISNPRLGGGLVPRSGIWK